MPAVGDEKRAQGQDGLSGRTTPAHTGLLEAGLGDNLTGRFNGAAANGIACCPELLVAHAPTIVEEINDGLAHDIR